MSDEDEQKLADYIESKNVRFPVIRAQGVLRAFGGRGYPTFVTIAPDGTIAGGDSIPSKGALQKLGKKSRVLPDLPPEFKGLRKPWKKRDWAEAKRQLDVAMQAELTDEQQAVLAALSKSIDGRIRAAESSIAATADDPDYFKSSELLERISKQFAGLPVADKAASALAEFEEDAEISKEIKLGKSLHKTLEKHDPSKASDRKKLIASLERFVDKYEGTKAATIAASRLEALRSGK